jgi:hypothetical protein
LIPGFYGLDGLDSSGILDTDYQRAIFYTKMHEKEAIKQ